MSKYRFYNPLYYIFCNVSGDKCPDFNLKSPLPCEDNNMLMACKHRVFIDGKLWIKDLAEWNEKLEKESWCRTMIWYVCNDCGTKFRHMGADKPRCTQCNSEDVRYEK